VDMEEGPNSADGSVDEGAPATDDRYRV